MYKGILWFLREIRPTGYDLIIDSFVTYKLKQAFMTYFAGGKYRIGFEAAGRESNKSFNIEKNVKKLKSSI